MRCSPTIDRHESAPFDTLKVMSFAGNGRPLSCMNDGLQVSTGASLGRGTIDVLDENPRAGATFMFENQQVTLMVKKEIIDRIQANIKAALEKYGGVNPEYFAHFRELAIQYWFELDRQEIFIESMDQSEG